MRIAKVLAVTALACGLGKWGMFESKCGDGIRVEHVRDQANGSFYGYPARYYK